MTRLDPFDAGGRLAAPSALFPKHHALGAESDEIAALQPEFL